MTIAFPLTDLISSGFFVDQVFSLRSRQELSTQANGIVRGRDIGSAIWMAEYTSIPIHNDDAPDYEAKLHSLDGVIQPFEAWDLRRLYPKAHSNGVFNDVGRLHSVDSNRKLIRISGLDAAFQLTPGDYLSFDYDPITSETSRALHQVVEAATANGAGLTPFFEVRPHLRDGYILNDPIVLKNPRGIFTLLPDSVSTRGQVPFTTISFKAVQYL